jgi:Ca2+-binding EF-hand superfamily protein
MGKLLARLTGRSADAEHLFRKYDLDRDGYLSHTEVYGGLESWGLNLQRDMFSQFIDCNFLYADRDLDGLLSLVEWTQLYKLMSEVPHQAQ